MVAAPSSPTTTILASSAEEFGDENPDLPDTWNAVDKMSKKRGVRRCSAVGHRRLGDLHAGHRRGSQRGRGERPRTRAGRVPRTARERTREAAMRLCGGDLDQAKKAVGKAPRRVRRLHAGGGRESAAAPPPRRRPCRPAEPRAGTQANAPTNNGSSPAPPTQAKEETERPHPVAADPQGNPAAEPTSQPANPEAPRGRGARAQPARDEAAEDRDRARSRRRGAGEPDPQRGSPRTDPGRAGAHGAAGDAGADQRGDQRAHGRAGRDVLPAGRPGPRGRARRGHERRLRSARTAAGGVSGEQRRRLATAAASAGYAGTLRPRSRRRRSPDTRQASSSERDSWQRWWTPWSCWQKRG